MSSQFPSVYKREGGLEGNGPTNLDGDGDEFGGTFSIPDDQFGEFLGETRELISERYKVGIALLHLFATFLSRSIREEDDGVVRGHIAIDGDGVERSVHRVVECGLEGGRRDGSVGGDET